MPFAILWTERQEKSQNRKQRIHDKRCFNIKIKAWGCIGRHAFSVKKKSYSENVEQPEQPTISDE